MTSACISFMKSRPVHRIKRKLRGFLECTVEARKREAGGHGHDGANSFNLHEKKASLNHNCYA